MTALALPAHAKLNLDLAVTGVRQDGYHELRTRFQAISLHDLLLIEPAASTALHGGVGGDEDLVLRAQRALESAAGRPLPARFRLVKRIPAGAGLGGGSADAAATLRGLARLHGLDVDLAPIAASLGADVPFLLRGGAAVATGAGERLTPAPADHGWYAVAWPGYAVSTAAVYAGWDRVGGDGDNELTRAAFDVEPKLAEFAGMLGDRWRMTGSGSAFFRRCATRGQAEAAVARLDCWTAVACPVGAWGGP
ncbi:MAG TPA: 4-(cytidine 5'-diphospho)-2-C-methyl-D-erythritol kinase [Candidatus Dormibacteraeota bacterium]